MRLYLVTVPAGVNDAWFPKARYAGTGAEATARRLSYFEAFREHGVKKSDITIEQVDVPTDKAGLLGYLNGIVG